MRTSRELNTLPGSSGPIMSRRHKLLDRLWLHRHLREYGDSIMGYASECVCDWARASRPVPIVLLSRSSHVHAFAPSQMHANWGIRYNVNM